MQTPNNPLDNLTPEVRRVIERLEEEKAMLQYKERALQGLIAGLDLAIKILDDIQNKPP